MKILDVTKLREDFNYDIDSVRLVTLLLPSQSYTSSERLPG